jgi:hypothetical protein
MSFLDNLENNLKALENREEKDAQAGQKREQERAAALAAQPHAEALKASAFVEKLLTAARTLGHQQRTMVRFAWLGSTLRLEAKDKKLDLIPTPSGIVAVSREGEAESAPAPVDLAGDAEALAHEWLK